MLVGWTKAIRTERGESFEPCACAADFQHEDGEGNKVDCHYLDHFARVCPSPPFSRVLAEAIYQDTIRNLTRYGKVDTEFSVTMLNKDPLHLWLEQNLAYVEDPLARKFMLRGTFAHEGLLSRCRGPLFTIEQALRMPIEGVTLYGTIDIIEHNPPTYTITDLKTQDIFAIDRKLKSTPAKVLEDKYVKNDLFQTNAYRVMLHDVLGIESKRVMLQYWDGNLRVYPLEVPLVDLNTMRGIMGDRIRVLKAALDSLTPPEPDPKNISSPPVNITKSGVYARWKNGG